MRPYKPHTTYVGRIVYDRKLHSFSPADLLRIQHAVISDSSTESELEQLMRDLSIQMLDILLGPVGEIFPPEKIFQWLYELVDATLGALQGLLTPNQYKEVAGLMALLIEENVSNV